MKFIKNGIVTLMIALFAFNVAQAQEEQKETEEKAKSQMFFVHTDNVKFEMAPKYEELAKKFKETCDEHQPKDISWTTVSVEDGRYVFVMPIENMAALDENPMKEMVEKVGKDKMDEMFGEFDTCYDTYSTEIVYHMPELSYTPKDYNTEGKHNREYHFLYYSPKHGDDIKDGMKKIKELFEEKGIDNGYQVYHSGLGSNGNYYMVSVSGSSNLEIAETGDKNDKIFGKEGDAAFWNVIKLTSNYDQVNAKIRPELSYTPKEDDKVAQN